MNTLVHTAQSDGPPAHEHGVPVPSGGPPSLLPGAPVSPDEPPSTPPPVDPPLEEPPLLLPVEPPDDPEDEVVPVVVPVVVPEELAFPDEPAPASPSDVAVQGSYAAEPHAVVAAVASNINDAADANRRIIDSSGQAAAISTASNRRARGQAAAPGVSRFDD
jgi:hypothetical protein